MKEEVDGYYRRLGKEHIEYLYDSGFLHDGLSIETIDRLEEYIGWLFQAQSEMAVMAALMSAKLKRRTLEIRDE